MKSSETSAGQGLEELQAALGGFNLAKVGLEVVIEQDHRPVAVIRPPLPRGRLLSECIALAEARGSTATLDEGFMKGVEEGIASRSRPWEPPAWE